MTDHHESLAPAPEVYGVDPAGATAVLWERIYRPFLPAGAVEALSGLSPMSARQLVGLGLATSQEAEALLGNMHEIVRSLAISTTSKPVRSVGEVRGPVMWSETMAARSSSPGAGDVYICASPQKAYDTEENRLLVHAIRRIRDAARDADVGAGTYADPGDRLRTARFNGTRASKALEHRTLASVSAGRLDRRSARKARSGAKARTYRSALAVIERADEPIDAATIAEYCDSHTLRQHALLVALHDALRAQGRDPGPFRVEVGTLRAGSLRYMHKHREESDGLYGILLGNLLVDVPDAAYPNTLAMEAALVARSGGHPALIVLRPADLDRAIELGFSA